MAKTKDKKGKIELIVLSALLVVGIPFYILTVRDAISSMIVMLIVATLFVLLFMSKLKTVNKNRLLILLLVIFLITVLMEWYYLIFPSSATGYFLETGDIFGHSGIRLLILSSIFLADVGLAIHNAITQKVTYKIISIILIVAVGIIVYYMALDMMANPVLSAQVWLWDTVFKPIFGIPFR